MSKLPPASALLASLSALALSSSFTRLLNRKAAYAMARIIVKGNENDARISTAELIPRSIMSFL